MELVKFLRRMLRRESRVCRPPHGVMWPLPDGGNWEGGTTVAGMRWVHVPNEGWKPLGPSPFLRRSDRGS